MSHHRLLTTLISCSLALALLFGPLAGCSWIRGSAIKLSESDIKNVKAGKKIAGNFLKTWPAYSQLIRGYFGEDFVDEVPPKAVKAMNELDGYSDKYLAGEELTTGDAYYTLGRRLRVCVEIIDDLVKDHADLLEYIPSLVSLL